MKTTNAGIIATVGILAAAAITSQVFAYNQIQTELDLGEQNFDVTSLQTFFADNSSIYPEGKVTGYFGSLTLASVKRFQAQYGLEQVGRVGPMTRSAVNNLIASGGWVATDMSGPYISSVSQSASSNSMTFGWNTNEMATAKVFYNTAPIMMSEGDINSTGFGSTNGWASVNDGLARTSQQVTVGGLMPNTQYYYTIVATDTKGNVSVMNPNSTFRTNN